MSVDQTGAPEAAPTGVTDGGLEGVSGGTPSSHVPDPAATGEAGNTDPETFDRSYVEKLRREAASHRTAAKQYEEVFAGYSPEQREYLFGLVKGLADPATQAKTAAEWKDIAERILGAEQPVGPTGDPDPEAQPLTIKQFKEMQAQRDAESQREAAIKQIETEAESLGFPPFVNGADGQPEPNLRYSMLLHAVQRPEIAGDMKKAAEYVQKYETSIIDAHAKSIQENSTRWPAAAGTAPNTGAAEQPTERPSFAGARKAALAWAAAKAGQA